VYSDNTTYVIGSANSGETFGYTTPRSFTAGKDDTVYVRVYPSWDTGTFAITYSTGGARPAAATELTGIKISHPTLSMVTGEYNYNLRASAVPATATLPLYTLKWTNSNPDAVTLRVSNSGVPTLTAIAIGTATITATTANGAFSATCEVTVTPVLVTNVSLNKSSTSIEVGRTETLTATVQPSDAENKAVTWSSSDETVATVEDGVVTAVAVGTATITASSTDGSNKSAACTVTVIPVAVTGISLNKTATTLGVGKTETLTLTFRPADATNKAVTWYSSDDGIATVEGGVVTAVALGTATITVTTADGSHTAACVVSVQMPGVYMNITFDQIAADQAPAIKTDIVLSRTGSGNTYLITLDNPGQYGEIEWNINGTGITQTGGNFTLRAADLAAYSAGKYFLTLEVKKGGKWYNTTVSFTLNN
jgi:uncharacterized protein YjdB